jgi:hypothetical protein
MEFHGRMENSVVQKVVGGKFAEASPGSYPRVAMLPHLGFSGTNTRAPNWILIRANPIPGSVWNDAWEARWNSSAARPYSNVGPAQGVLRNY